MQKKDLKSKMVVKCRNEEFYLVVDDVLVQENYFLLLSKYSENLIRDRNESEWDIVEIFEICNNSYSFTNNLGMSGLEFNNIGKNPYLKSLWKRTLSYDGFELIEGSKVWIVSKIGGISVIPKFCMKFYNEDYKYFTTEENALKYCEIFRSPLICFSDFYKNGNNDFEEYCENLIKETFLKAIEIEL